MPKIRLKKLDSITLEVLGDSLLADLGFQFLRGVFFRANDAGVRHLIMIDMNQQSGRFFVILGLDADQIAGDGPADELGACHATYLSPGGIRSAPVPYRAVDEASARQSLSRTREALQTHGLPWLDSFSTLTDVADALSEDRDYQKGLLFLEGGAPTRGLPWLRRYEARLLQMAQDEEVRTALADVRNAISRCEALTKVT